MEITLCFYKNLDVMISTSRHVKIELHNIKKNSLCNLSGRRGIYMQKNVNAKTVLVTLIKCKRQASLMSLSKCKHIPGSLAAAPRSFGSSETINGVRHFLPRGFSTAAILCLDKTGS